MKELRPGEFAAWRTMRHVEDQIFWQTCGEDRKSWHRTLLEIRELPDA